MDCLRSSRRARRGGLTTPLCVALCAALLLAAPAPARDAGTVLGRVTDGETGTPVEGATVIAIPPESEGGSQKRQEVQTTDAEGAFAFPSIPAGRYTISFVASGYRTSTLANVEVQAEAPSRADFSLPPLAAQIPEAVEEIVILGSVLEGNGVKQRLDADQFLNVLSAEEFSRFAANDVADGLKRVAGINVVEGQFAIIRGLEDRYSSTLYNGAPVPSPDPDRQSIQLDLFPSEVVSNLVVAKTFGPELPGNSSAGSIDIVTSGYPATEGLFDAKVYAKTGVNQNAWNEFLQFDGGSPMGTPTSGSDVLEQEYGGFFGGRALIFGREVRYKAIGNWGTDYETAEGFQEGRAPSRLLQGLPFGRLDLTAGRFDLTTSEYEDQLTSYGGFGFDLDEAGNHKIDTSVFWTRKNQQAVEFRNNGYLAGFDYGVIRDIEVAEFPFAEINARDFQGDAAGVVSPGRNATFDSWIASGVRTSLSSQPPAGHAWIASFLDSKSFNRRRDLWVYQVNGEHFPELLDGLHLSWAVNYATTTQDDGALGTRFYYEPCGITTSPLLACPAGVTPLQFPEDLPTSFPVSVDSLGPGKYFANDGLFLSSNGIDEIQNFGRLDGDYETELFPWMRAELRSGLWYERATRDVGSTFLDTNNLSVGLASRCRQFAGCLGATSNFAIYGDTPQELASRIFGDSTPLTRNPDGSLQGLLSTQSQATREIQAWNGGAKATLWEKLDLLGGVRLEKILIESKNDPFVAGTSSDGTPRIFPSKYLFFDRQDNGARGENANFLPPFNDQILGIEVPTGPCRDRNGQPIPGAGECVDLIDQAEIAAAVNGTIDQLYALPSAGLTYRAYDWLTLRGAWSQTVARPSFREIGYYVSVEPGTDDLTVGNPQLQLSEVQSWDARAEFLWGELGDLAALSFFYKIVQAPIEQIILRDPSVRDPTSLALFRTFFNNPNDATVWGIEVEARKNLGFLGPAILEYLSIGGNFSYIDAQVDRSEAELARSTGFFANPPADAPYPGLAKSRRLTNQPEWIANADVSFVQPEWGSKATLAFFAISDVLDAAGGATEFDFTGQVNAQAYVLDRYVDSFYQLDLIMSQDLWRGLALKLSLKNLTDSKRGIVYDTAQTTQKVSEREFRVGRDFSLALSWAFSGPEL